MDQNSDLHDSPSALIYRVADLDEDAALAIVRSRVAQGDNPFSIVEDCREGLRIVGERYERRDYFLSGLIMAGEIFKDIMELLSPIITENYQGTELGLILIGTVAGDIHDIGKNIFTMLLSSYGFTVVDLGVDVPAEEFLEKAGEVHPDIIGLSGLLTSSFESMKETIGLIRNKGIGPVAQTPVVIGGGTVDYQVCRYVGANDWANDAMMGVRLFKQMLDKKKTGAA